MTFDRSRLPDPSGYFAERGMQLFGPRNAKWKTTRCPFHGGSDSMRVNTTIGAWVCMSCGAKGGDVLAFEMQADSVSFVDAAKALGCWVDDGQPEPKQWRKPPPLPATQALQVLSFEALLAALAASNVARGVALTDQDRERLHLAAHRISQIADSYA